MQYLVLSVLLVFGGVFISGVLSTLSSVHFYSTSPGFNNLSYVPEIPESDAIALFAHTLRSSKHVPIRSNVAMKLLNTFVDQRHEGHHLMVWVPGMRSGDTAVPSTMTLNHDTPLSTVYQKIGKQRSREYGAKTDEIQNVNVEELKNVDLQLGSVPLFKLIHVQDISANSFDYFEKTQAILQWVQKTQAAHPGLTVSLVTRPTHLRARDLTSNCYASMAQCMTETNACHAEGTCVAHDNCYRCKCKRGRGGADCEYADASLPLSLCGGVVVVWVAALGLSLVVMYSAARTVGPAAPASRSD